MQMSEGLSTESTLGTRFRVIRVSDEPTSLGALVTAAILGVPAAVLLGAVVAQVVSATVWPLLTFVAAWPLSAWLLSREAGHALVVCTRGCVLGAALWLLLGVAVEPVAQAGTGQGGGAAGPFVAWLLSMAAPMLWLCLAGALVGTVLLRRPRIVERAPGGA